MSDQPAAYPGGNPSGELPGQLGFGDSPIPEDEAAERAEGEHEPAEPEGYEQEDYDVPEGPGADPEPAAEQGGA